MNTMKKQTITMALFLALCLPALAQKEYRIDKPSGKLYHKLNGARIERNTGNEIVLSNQGVAEEEDERGKGIQALRSSGYNNNNSHDNREQKQGQNKQKKTKE